METWDAIKNSWTTPKKYIETASLELESDYDYTAMNGSFFYVAAKGQGKVVSFKDVIPY